MPIAIGIFAGCIVGGPGYAPLSLITTSTIMRDYFVMTDSIRMTDNG